MRKAKNSKWLNYHCFCFILVFRVSSKNTTNMSVYNIYVCFYSMYMNVCVFASNQSSVGWKCIAVAMACAGMAAEPFLVRRHFSFPRKYRVQYTCVLYWSNSCEICTRHWQGSEKRGKQGRKVGDLKRALLFFLSLVFPPVGAGLLLLWVVVAATVGSWPP